MVEVVGAGMTLPAPVEIESGDLVPSGRHEQLERLEGMRVRVASLTTTGATLGSVSRGQRPQGSSNGVFHGVVTGIARPFREPGIPTHVSPLPARTRPCCVARYDGNPERLRVDSDGQPGARGNRRSRRDR